MEISDTGLAILSAAIGSRDTINRVVGPTASYIGEGLKGWTERRLNNVARIFRNAEEKLGDRAQEEGSVHPRVLKEILNDGSFAENDLAIEYFGGVLASSRTGVSRDDRGASLARLVARLSTYQIRSHFVFYRALRQLVHDPRGLDLQQGDGQYRRLFVPIRSYVASLALEPDERLADILGHTMHGLGREELIRTAWRYGDSQYMREWHAEAEEAGLVFSPSRPGIELFLWAHGAGHVSVDGFLVREEGLFAAAAADVPPLDGVVLANPPDPSSIPTPSP